MNRYRNSLAMALLLSIILAVFAFGDDESIEIPSDSLQYVKVFDAKGHHAKLARYEKRGGRWIQTGEVWSVNIGRNGVGKRREGDGKTPSGLYSLNEVYGYKTVDTPMPFYLSKEETLCIDDITSRYYNRIVNSSQVLKDYGSFEYMRRKDGLYEIVVTVGYNPENERGRGSCIFLHIGNSDKPTAGCVSMKKEQIERLARWLDPNKRPVIFIERF